jgi:hypothetical protein
MKGIHKEPRQEPSVKAGPLAMAKSLGQTAMQGAKYGKVSAEIRKERYDTCKTCPAYRASDKRCSECGCFMEAKTWVAGDPDMLCPLAKWSA